MAYIGSKPTIGNFQICDAISVVNGQAAYTMQVGSVNVIPQSSNHMIVSLNGTIQKPGGANPSFTVSGSTITFASNLVTNDVIDFIHILGDVLDLGVPSDATVTAAKLGANSVTAAKLNNDIISGSTELASEPADTDEFLVSDAGTLKRIDYSLIKGGGITVADQWRLTSNKSNVGTSADNTYYSTHEINQDHWRVHQNAGNNTVEYHQSQIFFTPFKSGNQAYLGNFMRAQGTRYDSSGNFRPEFSGGAYNHSDYPTATGFRIYYHTGDINKYNYKLYGIV